MKGRLMQLNPHNSDGPFTHDTATGKTKLTIGGAHVEYVAPGGVITPGTIVIRGSLGTQYDDGHGAIVDEIGEIVGAVDYETGKVTPNR